MVDASHPDGVDPLIGKVLDERYRIEAQLGEGGIGRVYTARHLTLGRMVALKVLLTRYESIEVLKKRFQREASALASLNHPNIVTVTDFGVSDTGPYIVMELLEGEDLASILARGEPTDPRRAFRIIRQMIRALAYAHQQHLVHRDLKPQNVFVRPLGPSDDHVEVLDFGLARFLDDAWKDAPKLTARGALIGTPAYMAPEQASGQDVDERADVYAAGLVLFEALTGRRTFEDRDPGQMLRDHLLTAPPTIAWMDPGLEVDPALEAFVARALAKSPRERFDDGAAMLEAFDRLGPEPARRVAVRPSHVEMPPRTSGVAVTQVGKLRGADSPATRTLPTEPGAGGAFVLPQRRAPLFLGAGCAALVLMGLGAGGVWLSMRGLTLGDTEDVTDEPPPPTPPAVFEPRPPDPFGSELPEPLRSVHDAVERGQEIPRAELVRVSQFQGDHPDDPRSHLLLAHIETDQQHWRAALVQYSEAFRLDARVSGDPYMLPDLVLIARQEEEYEATVALIRTAFGAAARSEIDRALRDRMPPEERRRLELFLLSLPAPP